jgi:alkaline phosphatase
MSRFLKIVCLFVVFSVSWCSSIPAQGKGVAQKRNVIFMVMDGTSADAVTLARWYKGNPLFLDKLLVGGVQTYSKSSIITDSAAAATAMATGKKTMADVVGLVPVFQGKEVQTPAYLRPVATVLEGAKQKGMAVGLVATSPIQHATPAAFSSHVKNREHFDDIAEQQVYQGLDLVLGGGKGPLVPQNEWKKDHPGLRKGYPQDKPIHGRKDGENLWGELENLGYQVVTTQNELKSVKQLPVWGTFADSDMAYDIDRKYLDLPQPSLAEMTEKSISLLSKDPQGFFLFVEGSKVDWSAHKNDPVGMVSEVLAFDKAVGEAIKFAKKDGNTLVIAVTDHGTGGLTIGNADTDNTYKTVAKTKVIGPLKQAKLTVTGALSQLDEDKGNLKEVVKLYGLNELTIDEWGRIANATHIEEVLADIMAKRAHLGFTTHGHTGEDVFLYAYGPEKPTGLLNNIDLAKKVAHFLGLSLEHATNVLFVDGITYFKQQGYDVSLDTSDQENIVMVAKKDGVEFRYPKNKNFYWKNDKKVSQPGVNVFTGETMYIPSPLVAYRGAISASNFFTLVKSK